MRAFLSLFVVVSILTGSDLVAQQNTSNWSSYRPGQDNCGILEAELLALLERKEQYISSTKRCYQEIKQLNSVRWKTQGSAREKLEARIEELHGRVREDSIQLARIDIARERSQIELDRLRRAESQLASGWMAPSRPATIEAINTVKFNRQGPTTNERRELGYYDTTTYEVVFSDGRRQVVESKTFIPTRR